MVVAVTFSPDGQTITALGKPVPLFSTQLPAGATYAVSADGERFLINAPTEAAPPIMVLSNWTSGKK